MTWYTVPLGPTHTPMLVYVLRWLADPEPEGRASDAVIRHGDEHDDPDGYCATCKALGIGPYAPVADPEPEGAGDAGVSSKP